MPLREVPTFSVHVFPRVVWNPLEGKPSAYPVRQDRRLRGGAAELSLPALLAEKQASATQRKQVVHCPRPSQKKCQGEDKEQPNP